jgi:hypothetical protein
VQVRCTLLVQVLNFLDKLYAVESLFVVQGGMHKAKFGDKGCIEFLIASPRSFSCTEVARAQPGQDADPAHEAMNRLLYRLQADPGQLREEVSPVRTD